MVLQGKRPSFCGARSRLVKTDLKPILGRPRCFNLSVRHIHTLGRALCIIFHVADGPAIREAALFSMWRMDRLFVRTEIALASIAARALHPDAHCIMFAQPRYRMLARTCALSGIVCSREHVTFVHDRETMLTFWYRMLARAYSLPAFSREHVSVPRLNPAFSSFRNL